MGSTRAPKAFRRAGPCPSSANKLRWTCSTHSSPRACLGQPLRRLFPAPASVAHPSARGKEGKFSHDRPFSDEERAEKGAGSPSTERRKSRDNQGRPRSRLSAMFAMSPEFDCVRTHAKPASDRGRETPDEPREPASTSARERSLAL